MRRGYNLRFNRVLSLGCVLAVSAVGVAACGDDNDGGGGGGGGGGGQSGESAGGTLNVYSSLPRQGAQRGQTLALENGIRLALQQAGGKAGNFQIKYEALDDSTAQAGQWTPEATSANARRVAQDDKAAAYIGEFNSGASAISLPILNEAGIPQISPSNTGVGLTKESGEPGVPDKYYPTGQRHFVRIVPRDDIQGPALVTVMKEDGCTSVAVTNDREVYGAGLATEIEKSAEQQGLEVLFNEGIDPQAPNYRSLASRAEGEGADCFVFAGTTPNNAAQIFRDFSAALGDEARLYGPDGVAESSFFKPGEGGIPADVARKTKVTVATLPPDEYAAEGRQFFEQYEQEFDDPTPDPYAIYGYEAMRLVLDAIERAGSSDRQAIIQALFATKNRESVLGTYSIDENGDTSLSRYAVYNIEDGELAFDQAVEAAAE